MEILHALGLYHAIERKGAKVSEYTFYGPNEQGDVHRVDCGPDVINNTPFPWTLSVEEGDIGDVLVEELERHCIRVEHSMELLNHEEHPHLPPKVFVKNGTTNVVETWYSNYVLGCDGAKSNVRQMAGIRVDFYGKMEIWAGMKFTAASNLPDIRRRVTVRAEVGNCVLVPCREGGLRMLTRAKGEKVGRRVHQHADKTADPAPSSVSWKPQRDSSMQCRTESARL